MTEPLDLAEMRRVAESGSCIAFDSALVLALIDQLEAARARVENPDSFQNQLVETVVKLRAKIHDDLIPRAEASEARLAQVEEALREARAKLKGEGA